MSVRLMGEVFKHVHGIPSGRRMLLLVLADFANDEGVCWPSIKSLATNADLGERHVSGELKALARDGYISIEEHAGKSNHYRVHSPKGMNHSSGVNQSASRTPVQGGDEPQFTTGDEPQATPPLNHSSPPLRLTPIEPPDRTTKEPSKGARSEIHQLVDAWAERRGFPPANWSKASKIAKDLHRAGVTPVELLEIYDWLEADPFWADEKGFDLGTALSQVDKFRQSKRTPAVGFRSRAKQSITERNMENNRKARVILEEMQQRQSAEGGVFETKGAVIR